MIFTYPAYFMEDKKEQNDECLFKVWFPDLLRYSYSDMERGAGYGSNFDEALDMAKEGAAFYILEAMDGRHELDRPTDIEMLYPGRDDITVRNVKINIDTNCGYSAASKFKKRIEATLPRYARDFVEFHYKSYAEFIKQSIAEVVLRKSDDKKADMTVKIPIRIGGTISYPDGSYKVIGYSIGRTVSDDIPSDGETDAVDSDLYIHLQGENGTFSAKVSDLKLCYQNMAEVTFRDAFGCDDDDIDGYDDDF